MSQSQPVMPPTTAGGAMPSRAWAESVLLYYKAISGMTFGQLATAIGEMSEVWLASAMLRQHRLSANDAERLCELLQVPGELRPSLVYALAHSPLYRGHLTSGAAPSDPTEYRLYEVLQIYGPAFHAIVNEKFGDGIMSAIDCHVTVDRVTGDSGEARVRLEINGKFLPYRRF